MAGALVLALSGCAWVSRVSVDSSGTQGNAGSSVPAISADGRYVTFQSDASNLVTGDTNNATDVFVRDTQAGTTTRASVDSSGAQGDAGSSLPAISADGRYIAFDSFASNLATGDTNGMRDVFVRDTQAGTTTRASVAGSGGQGNDDCGQPAISADGRYVIFGALASNLVAGDTNNAWDVFVRNTVTGTTTRVSVDSSGGQANNASFDPAISADGHLVAFHSNATNLVAGDTNKAQDVFARNTVTGATTRVSLAGISGQANSHSTGPVISGDGRYISFTSTASNLVAGDTNNRADVFVRDTTTGTTTRISVDTLGGQAGGFSYQPAISADGRYITFISNATNLVGGDTNGFDDLYVRANPVVTVSGVAPGSAGRGVATGVVITGTSFRAGVTVDAGSDVAVGTIVVWNETTITATLTPSPAAATGARNVVVTLPGTGPGAGTGTNGYCFSCLTIT